MRANVYELVRIVRDPKTYYDARSSAAERLKALGDPRAVRPLIAALQSQRSPEVRSYAARVLGHLGDARAGEPLREALRSDKETAVREAAASALARLDDARAVDPLIKALRSDRDPKVRRSAASELGRLGDDRAVEPLLDALDSDADTGVSTFAAGALGNLGDARAVEPLIQICESETWRGIQDGFTDLHLERAAMAALGALADQRAVEPLIAILRSRAILSPDKARRASAASALGLLGSLRAVEPLIEVLASDRDAEVRKSVMDALGRLGDARAVEPLAEVLRSDDDPEIRTAAADALAAIGDAAGVTSLIKALSEDTEFEVKRSAVRTLGLLGDARAVKPLLGVVRRGFSSSELNTARVHESKRELAVAGRNALLKEEATNALGRLGAVEALVEVLRASEELSLRVGAANQLGQMGDATAVEPLIEALRSDEKHLVRIAAATALGRLGDPRAVDPLIKALRSDRDPKVRRSAASELGRLGDDRAVEPLLDALGRHDEAYVKGAAAEALGSLGDRSVVGPMIDRLGFRAAGALAPARALARLGEVDLLLEALRKEGTYVAATALGELGHAAAAERLVELVDVERAPAPWQATWATDAVDALVTILREAPGEVDARILLRATLLKDHHAYGREVFLDCSRVRGLAGAELLRRDESLAPHALSVAPERGQTAIAVAALEFLTYEERWDDAVAEGLLERIPRVREMLKPDGDRQDDAVASLEEWLAAAGEFLAGYERVKGDRLEEERKAQKVRDLDSIMEAFLEAIRTEQWTAKDKTARELIRAGSAAIAPLIDALKDPNPLVRWSAAELLGRIGDPAAIDPLAELLGDDDEGVREMAAQALEAVGGPDAAARGLSEPRNSSSAAP